MTPDWKCRDLAKELLDADLEARREASQQSFVEGLNRLRDAARWLADDTHECAKIVGVIEHGHAVARELWLPVDPAPDAEEGEE